MDDTVQLTGSDLDGIFQEANHDHNGLPVNTGGGVVTGGASGGLEIPDWLFYGGLIAAAWYFFFR